MITFNMKVHKKVGRPLGSKNKSIHKAGGARKGGGRPKGSKNKPWHRAGRPRIPVSFFDRISKGAKKFLESPFN